MGKNCYVMQSVWNRCTWIKMTGIGICVCDFYQYSIMIYCSIFHTYHGIDIHCLHYIQAMLERLLWMLERLLWMLAYSLFHFLNKESRHFKDVNVPSMYVKKKLIMISLAYGLETSLRPLHQNTYCFQHFTVIWKCNFLNFKLFPGYLSILFSLRKCIYHNKNIIDSPLHL